MRFVSYQLHLLTLYLHIDILQSVPDDDNIYTHCGTFPSVWQVFYLEWMILALSLDSSDSRSI